MIVVVLMSGCLNSNVPASNPTIKNIDLDAKQLVLNDSDIKGILGNKWNNFDTPKQNTSTFSNVPTSSIIHVLYSIDPWNLGWGGLTINTGEFIYEPVDISIRVYNNSSGAKEDYLKLSNNYYKGTNITIGDEGSIYTIKLEESFAQDEKSIIKSVFRKNNVISIIYLTTHKKYDKNVSFNVDTAINLAKKQEAKISWQSNRR